MDKMLALRMINNGRCGMSDRYVQHNPSAKLSFDSIGNAFAISVALSFKTAVGVACIQWLWKTFRSKNIKIDTLDDCFELSTNVKAFFNKEILLKIKLAALLALVVW